MRALLIVSLLSLASPASAGMLDVTPKDYYGPFKPGHGVGYKEKTTTDGFWKIEFGRRGLGFAIDGALYRAAERARANGYRYVEVHNAYVRSSRMGPESATLFARGTIDAVHPAKCRSGKAGQCYTADVAVILANLSGPSGTEPGVAKPSGVDEYGRVVYRSGFGTGAVGGVVP